jgi:hypothetical protein
MTSFKKLTSEKKLVVDQNYVILSLNAVNADV